MTCGASTSMQHCSVRLSPIVENSTLLSPCKSLGCVSVTGMLINQNLYIFVCDEIDVYYKNRNKRKFLFGSVSFFYSWNLEDQ